MYIPNGVADIFYAEGWPYLFWTTTSNGRRAPIYRFAENAYYAPTSAHHLGVICNDIEGALLARTPEEAVARGQPVVCLDGRQEYPKFRAYIGNGGDIPLARHWERAFFSDEGDGVPVSPEAAREIRKAIREYWQRHNERLRLLWKRRRNGNKL